MHTLDKLRDALESEIMHQTMYNKYMIDIANPEVRQLFTQMRDGKMQHVTQLQQEVQRMMQQGPPASQNIPGITPLALSMLTLAFQ